VNRNPPFCGANLNIDPSGLIYIHSGCEQHAFFQLDKFWISKDTVHITRFDFLTESPFVYIRKTPTNEAFQEIRFLSIEGYEFTYRLDEVKKACFAYGWSKHERRKRLELRASTLRFRNGDIKVIDIPLLDRIFNVPEPIWIKEGFDYEIRLNFPLDLLQSCFHSVTNFKVSYLLVGKEEIVFPATGERFPIICRKAGIFR
jgi:hypothetical protein